MLPVVGRWTTSAGESSTCGGVVGDADGGEQSSERPVEQQARQTADTDDRQTGPASSTARSAAVRGARARTGVPGRDHVVVFVVGAVVEGGADAADARNDVDGARGRAVAAAWTAPDAARQILVDVAASCTAVTTTSATATTHHRPLGARRTRASLYTAALGPRRGRTVHVHVLYATPLAAHAPETGSR